MFPTQLIKNFSIKNLRKECNKSKSRIYGFILYTKRHPFVIQALRNNVFWDSLDDISGPNWPIFSVKPLEQGQWDYPKMPKGWTGYMVPTWNEPKVNHDVLELFGLDSSQDLPCFVTYIWGDDDKLKSIVTKINGNNENEVYLCLERIVKIIAKAESLILDDYKTTENVFREVSQDLEAYSFRNNYSGFLDKLIGLKSILNLFR